MRKLFLFSSWFKLHLIVLLACNMLVGNLLFITSASGATLLTVYGTKTDDTLLPNARQLTSSQPSNPTSYATTVNNSTGWVELLSRGGTGTIGSNAPTPSGNGFIWNDTALEGQQIVAGNWTASQDLKTSSGTVVADVHVRAYKRSSTGNYTLIVDSVAAGQTIGSGSTLISLPAVSGAAVSFGVGDKLYFDIVLKINTNNMSSGASIKMNENTMNGYLATPGYQAASGSNLIANLTVNDSANAANWSVQSNIQAGDMQYGDRTYALTAVPASVAASDWIRTANDSKTFTGTTLVSFKVNSAADVYVAHNDSITPKPAWMSGWTNTNEVVKNNQNNTYSLYKKSFNTGTTVSLGDNGNTSTALYMIIVKASSGGPPPIDPVIDGIIKTTLDGINSYGWDPANNGIYINWNRSDPNKINCAGSGICDARGSATRHDSQNDIRALQHMYWYKWRHPGDTSQNTAIARLLPTVKSKYGSTSSPKGWMYYVLLRLRDYTDNPSDVAYWENVIVNWAQKQYTSIDPVLGVQHDKNMGNCDCGSNTIYLDDAYRVDRQVELGAALVDAGTRFNHPEWVTAGHNQVMTVYNQAFSNTYNLFTRIYVVKDATYGNNKIWDTQAKIGEVSEEIDALVRAAAVTTNSIIKNDFMNISKKMLNALRTQPIHDTTNGGFYGKMYVGTNYDGEPGGKVSSDKEMRQGSLLGTLHIANAVLSPANQWSDLEAEMLRVDTKTLSDNPRGMFLPNIAGSGTLNGYPKSLAGYTFQMNADWSIYGIENWVSNESNSLALLGLQQVLTP
ncbi:hypothetical protein [Paenibacillus piri]|uniref:Uncharacterized protein n=1 Tax=Paenibacillus piri TaxID=2547395 RepID=A0A4R5KSC5_9BACL|nr:hypothetical protein [Paenibacillus piri]TDF98681.1 hypothetical protein E1757_09100 [Paenibacillus piri]